LTDLLTGSDVVTAAQCLIGALAPAAAEPERWDDAAGQLTWSCRDTIAHVVSCCSWYAALLARKADGEVEVAEMDAQAPPPVLLDAVMSSAAVLAAAVHAAAPADRAWHAFGIGDRSGFAAMGCDEILVHGWDAAAGLGLDYSPPPDLCYRLVGRLFPWAPDAQAQASPWTALLWANGRTHLDEIPPRQRWMWHCAPLAEWDGTVSSLRPEPAEAGQPAEADPPAGLT
jgi:uncharacterized protein (TIGR03083 family)